MNLHGFNDVRQREIRAVEPLVPNLSAFEVYTSIESIKRHKSPSIEQIPAKLIKAICSEFDKLVNSVRNKEELPEEWKS